MPTGIQIQGAVMLRIGWSSMRSQLVWMDRSGREVATVSPRASLPRIRSAAGTGGPAGHGLEPRNPAPVERLSVIDMAFRVDGNAVRAREPADLMASWSAEARELLARYAIEDPNELVAEITDEHVLLVRIARERDVPDGAVA